MQNEYTKWFQKSRPARSLVPISRFVGNGIFALKNGGYGCLFVLQGVDVESLPEAEVQGIVDVIRKTDAALPERVKLYEFLRKTKGFAIPREHESRNEKASALIEGRLQFLEQTANFSTVELFQALTIQQPKASGLLGKKEKPKEQQLNTIRMLAELASAADFRIQQLGEPLGLRRMDDQECFSFFSYLFGLEEWSKERKYREIGEPMDKQIPSVPVDWVSRELGAGMLTVGHRFVQMFSVKSFSGASRPNTYNDLLTVDSDLLISTCWEPQSAAETRKLVKNQEDFFGATKHNVTQLAAHAGNLEKLEKTANSQATDKKTTRLASVLEAVDKGHSFGKYSLRVAVHDRDAETVRRSIGEVHRVFLQRETDVIEERKGNLSAYYALCPGNDGFNVRKPVLRDDYKADRSFVFAPSIGKTRSDDLDHEYLNVYETRSGTPWFDDPYVDGVRVRLILGPTGSGKSVRGNLEVAAEQKYGGFTSIYDIGGSYTSTVMYYGGESHVIGVDGPRVALFAAEPTPENLKFRFGFVRMLLTAGGADIGPSEEDAIEKAVRRVYDLDRENRRLLNLLLPTSLRRYLGKWIEGGVYGNVFDNVEDSLTRSRLQCFDFQDITANHADLMEPVLQWLIHEDSVNLHAPENLGVPKHILIEEVHSQLKTRQLLEMTLHKVKTVRKNLGGVTLIGQSAEDLGENADLIINSCSSFVFLQDPTFNQERYARLFNLNEREIENIADLGPREALMKYKGGPAKIAKVNLDERMYWLFSTKPKERAKRMRDISDLGFDQALSMQAKGAAA